MLKRFCTVFFQKHLSQGEIFVIIIQTELGPVRPFHLHHRTRPAGKPSVKEAVLPMKKTIRIVTWIFMLCVVLILPDIPAVRAQEPEVILAERVENGAIVNGDRIVITCDAYGLAVSAKSTGTRLRSVPVTQRQTATRQVLTAIDPDAAVFEVMITEGDDILLKCDAGYLTSAASGNGLYYAEEPEDCSVWQVRDGVFLYNPNAVYTTTGGNTYRNYYLEYYQNYNYFTTYGKSNNSDPAAFTLSFYRMGNSLPEEGLINESYFALPVFETSDTHGYLADISSEPYAYRLAYISDARIRRAQPGRSRAPAGRRRYLSGEYDVQSS